MKVFVAGIRLPLIILLVVSFNIILGHKFIGTKHNFYQLTFIPETKTKISSSGFSQEL